MNTSDTIRIYHAELVDLFNRNHPDAERCEIGQFARRAQDWLMEQPSYDEKSNSATIPVIFDVHQQMNYHMAVMEGQL